MIALRHGIASSLLLLSVFFLAKEKNILFFITVIIAAQLHSAAYIAVIVFVVYHLPFNRWLWLAILMSSLVIGMYGIAHDLVKYFLSVFDGNTYIVNKLLAYTGSRYDVVQRIYSGTIVVQVLTSLITIMYYYKIKQHNPYTKAFLASYLVSTMLLIMLNDFGILANRLSAILAPAGCILAASFITLFKREEKLYVFIMIGFLTTLQFINISTRLFADYVFVFKL